MLELTFHKEKAGAKNKMDEMVSCNTSTKNNPFCQLMRKIAGSVCRSCYAYTQECLRKNTEAKFMRNGLLLSERMLKDEEIPFWCALTGRFNAFGELLSKIHYYNLIQIVEANPRTTFALWTKRLDVVKEPVRRDNLIHVYSSPIKNVVSKLPKGFDKTFTVFSAPFIRQNNVSVNCAQHCKTCLKCYTHNDVHEVREALR